jgi:hypothetical protein
MSWLITGGNTYIPMDSSAASYITAVETADGQVLEPAVRCAIDQFVLGCKTDGIWNAIKASCILAGARTLAGALVPLAGTAPTNVNFVSGDYNRKTGLVGDGSTKYLNSNRNNNADPQNSRHVAEYASTTATGIDDAYLGIAFVGTGWTWLGRIASGNVVPWINGGGDSSRFISNIPGFIGASRSSSSAYAGRSSQATSNFTGTSQTPHNANLTVFSANLNNYSDARLAFYSIGESLDLALLDARVSALITAFGVAIP